jgi:Family of unknown function (DUF6064)
MSLMVSEWWTYRLSDFLMFSPRTYHRLVELYNAEVWPAHVLTLGLGVAMGMVALRARAWAALVVFTGLALAWGWVAWAFHWQRYATINWAAVWVAAAFAVQALLMLVVAAAQAARGPAAVEPWPSARVGAKRGLALLLFALFVQPLVGVALGRPWPQVELFGIAPDPTVSATLGLLLMLRPAQRLPRWAWTLWPLPLLWCVLSGATAWAMDVRDAWLMPAIALLALLAATAARRAGSR